ncbi:MAG: type IV toxin-antitoxin system AbiEi family antitoxin domain-containing protein [Solirubrobacteraceae bacterium]
MGEPGYLTGRGFPLDIQVAALAAAQQGVFTLAQLTALGLSASAVRKRAAAGRLHRVHRAVYALVPTELIGGRGRLMAAALACGEGAVVSHRSAAALHGLRATDRAAVDVTVPGRAAHRHRGIDVHRSTTLTTADVTTVDDIPCTTVARTQIDLAEVLRRREVERAYEQAEVLQAFDLGALDDQLARNRHRRASPIVRALVTDYHPGGAPTESVLEEAFLALVRAAGLRAPERQAYIDPGDGGPAIRVDFAWRSQRLAIETDGRAFHSGRLTFENDRRRDQRLTLAGWRVGRVTERQVREEPERIARLVAGLLGLLGG